MKSFKWIGPFKIGDLLANCLNDEQAWPGNTRGVYLISLHEWRGVPNSKCEPLYVGGNTGKSNRFATRIGDLIADIFGFYGGGTGHHSGGQSLYDYCKKNDLHPSKLFIGWAEVESCPRCAEVKLAMHLAPLWNARKTPLLNKSRPPQCYDHNMSVR